jgi:hypothetical protein
LAAKTKPTVTWPTPTAITYQTALSGTQLNATASVPGAFAYTPGEGTVLSAGTHTLSVTFTPADATSYATTTAEVTLAVSKAKPVITWQMPAAIAYESALSGTQLNATSNVPGTFIYTPTVGTVLGVGPQTLSAMFTPADATDYDTATSGVTLMVNKSTPSITWATPAAIAYGTALSAIQLNATASVAGSFAYTPAAGTVLPAGSQALSTTFTPTDSANYTTARSSVTLAVTSVCSLTPTEWSATKYNKNPITAELPGSIYEGTVTTIRLTGGNLDATWKVQICPDPSNHIDTNNLPTVGSDSSSPSALVFLITAKQGSAGKYRLFISDPSNSAIYDSGQTLTILSSDDAKYVPCAGPSGSPKPNLNLGCSFVPLSFETTYEAFGKGVASRFVAVQVTVENRNPNSEFLLQDVRVKNQGLDLSSYDKKIPRAVSERAEQLSARAVIIRLTAATASVLTGIAGFAGSELLQDAAEIYAGPAQAGLQAAIPNLSTAELARMDDLGFSVASTEIPKSSAIAVVAFAPSDTLIPAHKAYPTCSDKTSRRFGWVRPTPNSYSTYKGCELQALFSAMSVSVTGTHVQTTNPSQPTLKLFIPSSANTIALAALQSQAGPNPITIQGSGLDGVTQVQATLSTDSKTVIAAKLQPLQGESSVDPNVALLSIAATSGANAGVYNIAFILKDGSTVSTSQSISVLIPNINPKDAKNGASVTIKGAGFGAAPGTVTFTGVSEASPVSAQTDPKNWTDTSVTVTVPPNAKPGSVVITSASGLIQTISNFTVDQ